MFLYFLKNIINLYFLITVVIAQIIDPIVELVIPIGILTNEQKQKWKHIQ